MAFLAASEHAQHVANVAFDTSLGGAVITSPVWLQWMNSGLQSFMLVGGAILIVVRFAIIIRHELKRRRKK